MRAGPDVAGGLGELAGGVNADGSLEVEVQLGLRQAPQPCLVDTVAGVLGDGVPVDSRWVTPPTRGRRSCTTCRSPRRAGPARGRCCCDESLHSRRTARCRSRPAVGRLTLTTPACARAANSVSRARGSRVQMPAVSPYGRVVDRSPSRRRRSGHLEHGDDRAEDLFAGDGGCHGRARRGPSGAKNSPSRPRPPPSADVTPPSARAAFDGREIRVELGCARRPDPWPCPRARPSPTT